ncbi:MAG TPA: proline racemase family protein [Acidimicrobiia bacterium]|nr:proline racemase family protein [Acidimicrobiia bacterium]
MDLTPALIWAPPDDWHRLTVIESHAGGEPFRVVVEGVVDIPGDTVLDRRRYAQSNLDHLRKALMWEPRGHADMYGGFIGPPASPDGDIAVLFVHNEGFSTMCGHGIIALSKVVLETGIMPASEPETTLRIDTPAGRVVSISSMRDGLVTATRFRNVPSFVVAMDATIEVPGLGEIGYDLAFGGAFYALVEVAAAGLDLDDAASLIAAGRVIKEAISGSREFEHPDHSDLEFLYGVIFTGPALDPAHHSRNVCVFADGEVDRSPTGTGVSARLAVMSARGEVAPGQPVVIESLVGSTFTGRLAETIDLGGREAIIPEIEGSAYITGRAEMWLDPDDRLGEGFLVR